MKSGSIKPISFFQQRTKSFRYAFQGLQRFFRTERNAWIHMAVTMLVIPAGIFLNISTTEFLFIIFAIGFVWAAEAFNTVIEKIMDHLSPGPNPNVKYIKDLSAGAVLLASITAAVAGLIIFIPKLLNHVIQTS